MKVLVFGCWDEGDGYPRTKGLLAALEASGVEWSPCRVEPPAAGQRKQRLIQRPWLWPGYLLGQWAARRRARQRLREELERQAPDLVLVPYPGHFAVHWARAVWKGPLILDLFLSAYDTAVLDRGMVHRRSPLAAWLRRLDRRAAAAADLVLMDTPQNLAFLRDRLGVRGPRLAAVPLCFEAAVTEGYRTPAPGEDLQLLFFGTGVPLHGLSVLIDAVRQVAGLRLSLVGGSTMDREQAQGLPAERLRLLPEFIPAAELRDELSRAHLVAGIFAASDKARRVVPCKVAMALAAGRPVLTARTPAVEALLRPGADSMVVEPGDPEALAAILKQLVAAPEVLEPMAREARQTHAAQFSPAAVGQQLRGLMQGLLCRDPAPSLRVSRPAVAEPVVAGRKG